jgi:hypothetical protein
MEILTAIMTDLNLASYEQDLMAWPFTVIEVADDEILFDVCPVNPRQIGNLWLDVCKAAKTAGLYVPVDFKVEHMLIDALANKVGVSWRQSLVKSRR